MKRFSTLFLAAFLLAGSTGTSFVRGLVTDEYSNPLAGVKVVLKGERGEYFAYTGETGFFTIKEVKPGVYSFTFSMKGFETKRIEEVRVPAARPLFLKVSLVMGKKGERKEKRKLLPDRIDYSEGLSLSEQENIPVSPFASSYASLLSQSRAKAENVYWLEEDLGRELFQNEKASLPVIGGTELGVKRGDFSCFEERFATAVEIFSSQPSLMLQGGLYSGLPQQEGDFTRLDNLKVFSLAAGIKEGKVGLYFSWNRHEESLFPYGFNEKAEKEESFWFAKASYGLLSFRAFSENGKETPSLKYASFLHEPGHTPSTERNSWAVDIMVSNSTPSLSLSLKAGIYTWSREEIPSQPRGYENPLTAAFDPMLHVLNRMRKYSVKGDFTWLHSYLFKADHIFRGGLAFEYFTYEHQLSSPNPVLNIGLTPSGPFLPGLDFNYTRVYQAPSIPQESNCGAFHFALYGQDNWGLGKLNIFVSFRYDYYKSNYSAFYRRQVTDWAFLDDVLYETHGVDLFKTRVVPGREGLHQSLVGVRVGVSHPIYKSGVLKAGFARFIDPLYFSRVEALFPMGPAWADVFWQDINGDGLLSEEEIKDIGFYHPPFPDPDLPAPFNDIMFLSLSYALPLDFEANFMFAYESSKNRFAIVNSSLGYTKEDDYWIERTVKEPGPDGLFGTADDSTITYYVLDREKRELNYILSFRPLNELDTNSFRWTLSLRRPFYNGFSLFFNATYRIFNGVEDTLPFVPDPNGLINLKASYSELQVRGGGTLQLPFKTYLSFFYLYSSGRPYRRKLVILTEEPWPFNLITVNASAPGYEMSDPVHYLNLTLSKRFNLSHVSGEVFLHLFNLLDSKYEQSYRKIQGYLTQDGQFIPLESWSKTLRRWGGRSIRFGIKLSLY